MPTEKIKLYKPSELGGYKPLLYFYNDRYRREIPITEIELKAIEAILGLEIDPNTGKLYGYDNTFIAKLTKTVNRKANHLIKKLNS